MRLLLASALLLQFALPWHADAASLVRQKLKFRGHTYEYAVSAPQEDRSSDALPVLVVLHGAGGNAMDQITVWQKFAKTNRILLIAPELPRTVEFEDVAAPLFRQIVETVKERWNVDPKRVYVFGHSMGGYLTYDAAMLESEYFAAVAVHAAFIEPSYYGIIDKATRKIPIAIYSGDKDQLMPIANVRGTSSLLASRGFPMHYVELPGHDHNYYEVSGKVNSDVWEFLRKQHLE